MTEALHVDNRKEAQDLKSGIWMALAVLVINRIIFLGKSD